MFRIYATYTATVSWSCHLRVRRARSSWLSYQVRIRHYAQSFSNEPSSCIISKNWESAPLPAPSTLRSLLTAARCVRNSSTVRTPRTYAIRPVSSIPSLLLTAGLSPKAVFLPGTCLAHFLPVSNCTYTACVWRKKLRSLFRYAIHVHQVILREYRQSNDDTGIDDRLGIIRLPSLASAHHTFHAEPTPLTHLGSLDVLPLDLVIGIPIHLRRL